MSLYQIIFLTHTHRVLGRIHQQNSFCRDFFLPFLWGKWVWTFRACQPVFVSFALCEALCSRTQSAEGASWIKSDFILHVEAASHSQQAPQRGGWKFHKNNVFIHDTLSAYSKLWTWLNLPLIESANILGTKPVSYSLWRATRRS